MSAFRATTLHHLDPPLLGRLRFGLPHPHLCSRARDEYCRPSAIRSSQIRRWTSTLTTDGTGWKSAGLQSELVEKLKHHYTHASTPTDAQKGLLLALQRSDRRDIMLRDGMGRGKTFVMALASVQLALQNETILILVPSMQLAQQVSAHLDSLVPENSRARQSISITTPQAALQDERIPDPKRSTMMIDEPEAMLAPLPPRHLPPPAMKSHPFHRHPPPLAVLLDRLLPRGGVVESRTVWVGAELNGLLKRVIRQRGWAARDALELDFGSGATPRAKADIGELLKSHSFTSKAPGEVVQVGLVVDIDTGEVLPHDTALGGQVPLAPPRTGRPDVHQALIDTLVSYESQYATSTRQFCALVLPPEGYPLDLLAARINETAGIDLGDQPICSVMGAATSTPMIITSRSAVPGLDIPTLRRIYLIDGLDLAGLSPAQRSRGGLKRRLAFHDVVRGRLGRLGSVTAVAGGEVISLITRGSGEEVGLSHILAIGP